MFNKYGFFITKDELLGFFEIVDLNRDFSLNLDEFKACMLDDKAKSVTTRFKLFEVFYLDDEKSYKSLPN
jgi:hypothetical protein